MSSKTVVDERVVTMDFNNSRFEKNVQTSLSTIDRLKKALRFDGATKGLESINEASKKCNLSPLSGAVENVKVQFSAMEVMALTVLQNITNSAMRVGQQMVSAFTIDPIHSGFQEYETQINAVQTILANTSSKGTTLEQVNNALNELNHYADLTIYNFTEMTRNIGTFTAAGVDLNTSVAAIKGIANLAAVSGSTSQQASTAMYQLSQALAAGTVKLQDWNSVVNAGMGGQVFQDSLKATAKVHGIAIDQMIKDEGSFRETLSKGWLTSEILTETLSKFTGDLSAEQIKALGYTEEETKSILEMGKTASDAATKVKTFTQLFDTLKEAAQSGWTQSWQTIIGDFSEAKEHLTQLSDLFSGFINNSSNRRNSILEGAFSSKWAQITAKINNAGIETETFQNKITELAKSHNVDLASMIEEEGSFEKAINRAFREKKLDKNILKDALQGIIGHIKKANDATADMTAQMEKYDEIVNKVLNGSFGNGADRVKALTEAGYDYATVQNLVNEKLGSSVRHMSDLTDEQIKNADSLVALSDEQLESKGYTEEQITALRDLQKEADTAGSSINELINGFEIPSGAELMWGSISNVIYSVAGALGAVKNAWNDVFYHGMSEEDIIKQKSDQLYGIIKAVNSFTKRLEVTDDVADKLVRTFKGLFSIVNIITTITSGGLRLALKTVSIILNAFDLDILSVTANLGDMLTQFSDFILKNEQIEKGIVYVADAIKNGYDYIKNWIDAFLQLSIVQTNVTRFKDAFAKTYTSMDQYFSGGMERIREFIDRLKALDGITLADLRNILKDFKDNVVDYFLDIDGRFDVLSNAISKFKNDIAVYFLGVGKTFDDLKVKIFDFVDTAKAELGEHMGEILTIGLGLSMVYFTKKVGDVLSFLAAPFKEISGIISSFNGMLGACTDSIKAFTLKTKSEAIKNIAISIGILAASLALLSRIDQQNLWSSVGALSVVAAELVAVSAAMGLISTIGGTKGSASMLGIAASLLILVKAINMMNTVNRENLDSNLAILGGMAIGLAAIAGILGQFSPELSKGTIALLSISIALNIMVRAIKQLDGLHLNSIDQTIQLLVGAMGSLVLLSFACRNIKIRSAVGIIGMVVAIKIFVGVFEDIASLDMNAINKNIDAFAGIFASISLLFISSTLAGTNVAKAGVGLLAMSGALILITTNIKMLASVGSGELKKAMSTISQLLLMFSVVVAASHFAGENAVKAGGMMIAMSGAILLLTGAIVVLGHLKADAIDQAISAIAKLELLFAGLMIASKFAGDATKTVTILAVSVGLIAVSLATLSFIKPERLDSASRAMIKVLGMFTVVIAATHVVQNAKGTLVILAGTMAILGGIIYILGSLPTGAAIESSKAMSLLLLTLSASMIIIGKAGKTLAGGYIAVVAMTATVAALAAIIGVLASFKVGSVLEIAEGLSILLLSLSASCLILSGVGFLAEGVITGIVALVAVVASLGALMVGLGALNKYIPGLEEFLNGGISVLEKIGEGLGAFIGGIGAGVVNAYAQTVDLVPLGENLSSFSEAVEPFVEFVKSIDDSTLNSAKNLADMILVLTTADIINALTSKIFGGSSMSDLGDQLSTFGTSISKFANSVDGLNSEAVENAANAGRMVADLAKAIPNTDGVLGDILGNNDIDDFGTRLKPFGDGLVAYANSIKDLDVNAVEKSSTAGKVVADLAGMIPNTGGVLGDILGNNDIDEFGKKLPIFGNALSDYSTSVQSVNVQAVLDSVPAVDALIDVATVIPRMGGAIGAIAGNTDLGTFGDKLVIFGNGLNSFSGSVEDVSAGKIIMVSTAAKTLVDLQNKLADMSNGMTLSAMGGQLESFGKSLKTFYGKIVDVDTSKMNTIVSYVSGMLTSITNSTSGLDLSPLTNFMSSFTELGSNSITKLTTSFSDSSGRVTTAISNMLSTVSTNIQSGNEFQTTGSGLMTNLMLGIQNEKNNVQIKGSECAQATVTAIRGFYSKFKTAGKYLVDGFVAGINENIWKAEAQAKAMAKAAADAAAKELDEHSPSKVGHRIGDFFGQGFVNAISDYKDIAYNVSSAMASSAKSGLSNSISKLKDLIDGNLETSPTIRPILDLSDVESKSSRLNAMFTRTQALHVSAGIRAVAESRASESKGGTSSGGDIYNNFTQNNYSPKALSRIDIYRDTKNQLSALKGMVNSK